MTSTPPPPVNVTALARAIRFALVCLVLGFCYFNVRFTLKIDAFGLIYKDMLNGQPWPAPTVFVFKYRILFKSLTLIVPFCAVVILFSRELVRSFYALGLLALLTLIELVVLSYALFSPLAMIIRSMGEIHP